MFSRAWQVAGRVDQLRRPGQYVTCETAAGEPIVVVRGSDDVLRGFFNVCRHHAAAVVTEPEGSATTCAARITAGRTRSTASSKARRTSPASATSIASANGLVPVDVDVWEKWVFVRVERDGPFARGISRRQT